MNEELQIALAEMFNSVIDAKDFLVGELPEYIEQLLMWNIVLSLIWFVAGAATMIFFAKKAYFFHATVDDECEKIKQEQASARASYENGESWCFYSGRRSITSCAYDKIMRKSADDKSELIVAMTIVYGIFSFVGLCVFACNFDWLQIMIAPKVWLVEYAASLAK